MEVAASAQAEAASSLPPLLKSALAPKMMPTTIAPQTAPRISEKNVLTSHPRKPPTAAIAATGSSRWWTNP